MNTFELQILNLIQKMHCPFLDVFNKYLTALGNGGIIWIILAVVLVIYPKTRKVGITLSIGLVCHLLIINYGIKPLVARERPYTLNPDIQLLIPKPEEYSFPSGHSCAAFLSVTILFLNGMKKEGYIAFVLAGLLAFSRLYLYVHYPTDVLAGIVLGVFIGYMSQYIVNLIIKRTQKV